MPTEQDIISLSFDYKKIQGDVDKSIAELERFLSYADKLQKIKLSVGNAEGFATSKKGADDLGKILKEQPKILDDYNKALQRNAEQLVKDAKAKEQARFETSKMNKELKATVEIENAEAGSIAKARAELKALNLLRNNTTTATKEGREELKRLNIEIDRNNKFIKENADAYLKQKINIGNYPSLVNGLSTGVSNLANGLLATIGVTAGLTGIISFFSGAVDEANQAEQATTRFRNALRNIGREDVFDRLTEKANDFVNTFRYLDNDDVTEVFQQLISYGKLTEKQITDLTPVIINFAAKTGMSLNDATSTLIKAFEGQGRALKDFGINIKDGSTAAERYGIIMTELKAKVEGAGDAFSGTFAGKTAIARQEINNLKEDIGTKLLPFLSKFYTGVSGVLTFLSEGFKIVKLGFKDIYDGGLLKFGETYKKIGEAEDRQRQVNATASNILSGTESKTIDQKKALIETLTSKIVDYQNQYQLAQSKGDKNFAERLLKTADGYRAARETLLKAVEPKKEDNSVLGSGDLDKTEKSLSKTVDLIAELRKQLAAIQIKQQEGIITIDEADTERIKRYTDTITKLLESGNVGDKEKAIQLSTELNPISIRVLNKDLKKLAKDAAADAPPVEMKVALSDDSKAYEDALKGRENLNTTALNNELAANAEAFSKGLINAKEYGQNKLDIQKSYTLKGLNFLIEELQNEKDYAFKGLANTQEIADKKNAIDARLSKAKLDRAELTAQQEIEIEQATVQKYLEIGNAAFELGASIVSGRYEREKNQIQELIDLNETRYSRELENIQNSALSEQEKADKIKIIEAEKNAKKEQLDKRTRDAQLKQAKFERDAQALSIFGNALAAHFSIIKQLGAAGLPLAIANDVLAGIQIAALYAKPLPKYAKGLVNNPVGHVGLVGEAGPEIIDLPGHPSYIADKATVTYLPKGANVTPVGRDRYNEIMQRGMLRQTAVVVNNKSDRSDHLMTELIRETKKINSKGSTINLRLKYDTSLEELKKKYFE